MTPKWLEGQFTVGCLLFGDSVDYAARCLKSILVAAEASPAIAELRIGLNAPSEGLRATAAGHATVFALATRRPARVYEALEGNIGKYPMMRAMLHGDPPVSTKFFTWLDDDSYFLPGDRWVSGRLSAALAVSPVVGKKYRLTRHLPESAVEFFKAQPWFSGKRFEAGYRPDFATGGWWTGHTAWLRQWDYPFKDLYHNGGDVALGILNVQRPLPHMQIHAHPANFEDGFVVNAAMGTDRPSSAKRRGLSTTPYGYGDFPRPPVPDPTIHLTTYGEETSERLVPGAPAK